jgi:hypothetical protein
LVINKMSSKSEIKENQKAVKEAKREAKKEAKRVVVEETRKVNLQNTQTNIVYLNSIGSSKFNIYTATSLNKESSLSKNPKVMENIRNVLKSGVPLSTEYIMKAQQYLVRNRTRVSNPVFEDLLSRTADDEFYDNYTPQNIKVNVIANRIKTEVLEEKANVPKEVAKETIGDAFIRTQLAKIKEDREERLAQIESGLIKKPIEVIVPVVPIPYFENLGDYGEILNDLFATYDFEPEEIMQAYSYIGTSQERAEEFILDQEAVTPGYVRKVIEPLAVVAPPPVVAGPELNLGSTPTDPEVEAEVLAEEEDLVKEEGGEQEVKDDSLLPVAKNIIINNIPKDRYHPIEIEWFFGSKDVPDWDTVLERQVISSNLKPSEIKEKMKLILESSGPKMGINKNISDTLEELNELQQIHFCILRSLNRGVRYRTVTVKESDMLALKQSAKTLPDDPEVGVEVQSSKPQDTFSDSIILSVAEEDAKFQKAYNTRLFDNAGRSVAAIGEINTTKTVYSGNENASLHRPSNLLDSFSRPGASVINNHQRKGR